MKKNKMLFYAIIILSGALLLFIPAKNVFNSYWEDDNVLIEAFRVSGAEIVEANVNVYSAEEGMFLNKDEVTSVVKALASEMELDYEDNEKRENFDDDYNQVSLIGQNLQGHTIVVIVNSMDFTNVQDSGGGSETSIVLDVSVDGQFENLGMIEKVGETAVNKFIKGARATSCIIGRYEDDVPDDVKDGIVDTILSGIGAEEVERTIYDGMVSVSAYTPRVDDFIKIGRNKINFNIAMRYNSYEGKTYIWLGTPVISTEY